MNNAPTHTQSLLIGLNQFIRPGEWMSYGDVADLLHSSARGIASANVGLIWQHGVDVPLVKASGETCWQAPEYDQPDAAKVMESIAAKHERNGLPREVWPQDRRVMAHTMRARIAAALKA